MNKKQFDRFLEQLEISTANNGLEKALHLAKSTLERLNGDEIIGLCVKIMWMYSCSEDDY
jgi:hypothetical protein